MGEDAVEDKDSAEDEGIAIDENTAEDEDSAEDEDAAEDGDNAEDGDTAEDEDAARDEEDDDTIRYVRIQRASVSWTACARLKSWRIERVSGEVERLELRNRDIVTPNTRKTAGATCMSYITEHCSPHRGW